MCSVPSCIPDRSTVAAIRSAFEEWYKLIYWEFDQRFCRYDEATDKYDHLDVDLAYSAFKAGRLWSETQK